MHIANEYAAQLLVGTARAGPEQGTLRGDGITHLLLRGRAGEQDHVGVLDSENEGTHVRREIVGTDDNPLSLWARSIAHRMLLFPHEKRWNRMWLSVGVGISSVKSTEGVTSGVTNWLTAEV